MDPIVSAALKATEGFLADGEFNGTVRISIAGDAVLKHASGLANRADRVPISIDTRFGIASVTKMFTAAAVARLVDRGSVTFDTPVTDVLPADQHPNALTPEITVHHLLTHTSGLADYYDETTLGAAAFEYVWETIPTHTVRTPADFLPLFKDLPPLAAPGSTEASYCSAGYILLGLIIEAISGSSYIEFVTTEIFAPAGMQDSAFFALNDVQERVAIGYIATEDGGWKTNLYAIPIVGGPDGGAYSTVGDLDRFLTALDSGVLLKPETWAAMCHPHVGMEELSYGYGLVIAERDRFKSFGHGGADPGFGARAYRYPTLDMNMTMLGNTIDEVDDVVAVFRKALNK